MDGVNITSILSHQNILSPYQNIQDRGYCKFESLLKPIQKYWAKINKIDYNVI